MIVIKINENFIPSKYAFSLEFVPNIIDDASIDIIGIIILMIFDLKGI